MTMQLIPEFNDISSASNGTCYLCGASRRAEEPGVVSTGKTIDFEGVLEVCVACVTEMGSLFGMLPAAKADELRKKNREFGRQRDAAEARLAKNDVITDLVHQLQDAK